MRRRRRAIERQEKRKDKQPVLKKLRAVFLLRSFRGQHGEKMEESAWDNRDLGEGQ